MGLFGSGVPAVVKKWLPRDVRHKINQYRPEYVTSETRIGVWIEVATHEVQQGQTWTMLTFEYPPVRIVEWLNPIFQNAETDWPELVEVAAWLIRMENQDHIALAKQMTSELGNHHFYLHLRHDKCTTYQSLDNPDFLPLQQVVFS
jgi:hypothetical protein